MYVPWYLYLPQCIESHDLYAPPAPRVTPSPPVSSQSFTVCQLPSNMPYARVPWSPLCMRAERSEITYPTERRVIRSLMTLITPIPIDNREHEVVR